jgi:hypothetical protein
MPTDWLTLRADTREWDDGRPCGCDACAGTARHHPLCAVHLDPPGACCCRAARRKGDLCPPWDDGR